MGLAPASCRALSRYVEVTAAFGKPARGAAASSRSAGRAEPLCSEARESPIPSEMEMNEDVFNMELRKFLKKVGVTSQREIEQAVRGAIESGKLSGNEALTAKVRLSIEGLDLDHEITGNISLD
jgi:hypothetical protein